MASNTTTHDNAVIDGCAFPRGKAFAMTNTAIIIALEMTHIFTELFCCSCSIRGVTSDTVCGDRAVIHFLTGFPNRQGWIGIGAMAIFTHIDRHGNMRRAFFRTGCGAVMAI